MNRFFLPICCRTNKRCSLLPIPMFLLSLSLSLCVFHFFPICLGMCVDVYLVCVWECLNVYRCHRFSRRVDLVICASFGLFSLTVWRWENLVDGNKKKRTRNERIRIGSTNPKFIDSNWCIAWRNIDQHAALQCLYTLNM